jgi:hypothetical protein
MKCCKSYLAPLPAAGGWLKRYPAAKKYEKRSVKAKDGKKLSVMTVLALQIKH